MTERSYTSQWRGWRSLSSDLLKDYRAHLRPAQGVSQRIEDARAMEQLLFDRRLSDCDILDVGPGQVPVQLIYFQLLNRAIGIDVNRVIEHRTAWALIALARRDGCVRALKTLGRWAIGVDTKTRKAVAAHLGLADIEWPTILQMDVRDLQFPDASFDFIYSRSVFQHIQDPRIALEEIRRTLRPEGSVHISLHLWTCPNGYTYVPATSWEWPHLRALAKPSDVDRSRNRLRLDEWRQLFSEVMPGARFLLRGPANVEMITRANELAATELQGYSVEELVNYEFTATWSRSTPQLAAKRKAVL